MVFYGTNPPKRPFRFLMKVTEDGKPSLTAAAGRLQTRRALAEMKGLCYAGAQSHALLFAFLSGKHRDNRLMSIMPYAGRSADVKKNSGRFL
jgi:hypothetical protein